MSDSNATEQTMNKYEKANKNFEKCQQDRKVKQERLQEIREFAELEKKKTRHPKNRSVWSRLILFLVNGTL